MTKALEVEVDIVRVGLQGQGVGTDCEKNLYFVPGALPGDRALVSFEPTQKRYRDAELVRVIVASADRITPECPYFQNCGGCDWLNWKYESQVAAKEAGLTHILGRASLQPLSRPKIIAAEKTVGYRNRVQVRRDRSKTGFVKKRSRDIVDIETCLVAEPKINAALSDLRATPAPNQRTKIELYLDRSGQVRTYEIRAPESSGFAQIHSGQNEKLRELTAREIKAAGSKSVLELFSGDGNLTKAYVDLVERIVCVDGDTGKTGARAVPETPKIEFVRARVDAFTLGKLPPGFASRYDTLLLDPPRQGAGVDFSCFIHPDLKTIIYISCGPVSFTQDVEVLKREFRLDLVQAIDMFPHTHHIELISRWTRV